MDKLENLTINEFKKLKSTGLLWEIYPEAPEFWRESKKI